MLARKFMSLATAASIVVASGTVALTMPGCGEEENATVQTPDVKDLQGSQDYMKDQMSKKKKK